MAKKVTEMSDEELATLLSEIPEGTLVEEENLVDEENIIDDDVVFDDAEEEIGDADLELTDEEKDSLDAESGYGESEEEVVENADDAEETEEDAEELAQDESEEEVKEDDAEESAEDAEEEISDEEHNEDGDAESKKKGHPVLKFFGGLAAFAAVAGVSGVGGYHLHKYVFDKPHQVQIDKDEDTFELIISYLGSTGVTIKDIAGDGFIYSMSTDDNGNELVYYSYQDKISYYVALTDAGYEQFANNQDGNIKLKPEYFDGVESKRTIIELYLGAAKNNITELENEITALNLRLTAERKKVNELKNGIAEINKLFADPEDETVNDSIESLKTNVQTLIANFGATQEKIKDLNNKYGVEGSDSLDDIENALQDAETVKNKIKELNNEYGEEGSDSLESIENALEDAKAVNQAVAQTIAKLEELLGKEPSGSDKMEDLYALVDEMENKYSEAVATAAELQEENDELNRQLDAYRSNANVVNEVVNNQSQDQDIVANGGGTDGQNTKNNRGEDVVRENE